MNPLTDILTARARKRVYAGYALIGLVLAAIQVGYSAAAAGQPTWLTVSLAVFAFLGTGLGLTASANTHPRAAAGRRRLDERGGIDILAAGVLTVIVLAIALLLILITHQLR